MQLTYMFIRSLSYRFFFLCTHLHEWGLPYNFETAFHSKYKESQTSAKNYSSRDSLFFNNTKNSVQWNTLCRLLCDYIKSVTTGQTDTGQSDLYVPLCFACDTKIWNNICPMKCPSPVEIFFPILNKN